MPIAQSQGTSAPLHSCDHATNTLVIGQGKRNANLRLLKILTALLSNGGRGRGIVSRSRRSMCLDIWTGHFWHQFHLFLVLHLSVCKNLDNNTKHVIADCYGQNPSLFERQYAQLCVTEEKTSSADFNQIWTYLVDSPCLYFGLHNTPFLEMSTCKSFRTFDLDKTS